MKYYCNKSNTRIVFLTKKLKNRNYIDFYVLMPITKFSQKIYQYIAILFLPRVCVLTSIRSRTVWPNYGVVGFQDSVSYCLIPILCRLLLCILSFLSTILILSIATTRFHLPTWASPVSDPEYLSATWGHFPTWASLVSVPACRLSTFSSLSLPVPVPIAWPSPNQSSSSL